MTENTTPLNFIKCTTMNSGSPVTISFRSVSHVVKNKSVRDENRSTTWINFHSGKSIHVNTPYEKAEMLFTEFLNFTSP